MAVLPARARRPKNKDKVENSVLVVMRGGIARPRHQRFFSLNELNRSLRDLLTDLNQRPFKKLPNCRASAFAEMTSRRCVRWRQLIASTPNGQWRGSVSTTTSKPTTTITRCRASTHVDRPTYATRSTVEIFLRGQRIASRPGCTFKGRHTTVASHMPPAHREVAGWNAQTRTARAEIIGPRCAVLVQRLLDQRQHPQQAYRSCLGVLAAPAR